MYTKPSKLQRMFMDLGMFADRKMFWSWYTPRNFGDWIGPYLYECATGRQPLWYRPKGRVASPVILGAGSILRHVKTPECAVIWGSGVISLEDQFERPLKVLAVRGPRTAKVLEKLGYQTTEVFGDPAILLPNFYTPTSTAKRFRVGFIPHFSDYGRVNAELSKLDGIKVIDVSMGVEDVVNAIVQCEVTLSSSLHGIIVSHAYGIKCGWVEPGHSLEGDGTKFHDYYDAIFPKNAVKPFKVEDRATLADLEQLALDMPFPSNLGALGAGLEETMPFAKVA